LAPVTISFESWRGRKKGEKEREKEKRGVISAPDPKREGGKKKKGEKGPGGVFLEPSLFLISEGGVGKRGKKNKEKACGS